MDGALPVQAVSIYVADMLLLFPAFVAALLLSTP